jgi:dipeptidyl aminopeptidase/acylaminoacyl peptidase
VAEPRRGVPYTFYVRTPGGVVRALPGPGDQEFFRVSPDGRRVIWLAEVGSGTGSGSGTVRVMDFGGPARVLSNRAVGVGIGAWSADSTRVLVTEGSPTRPTIVAIDVHNGHRQVLGRTEGALHLAWSADGDTVVGYTGENRVVLLDARNGHTRMVPGISVVNHVESLSPDGRRVIVNLIRATGPGGDPAWPVGFTPTIVDTKTGAHVPIPVAGHLIGAQYLADGGLVVRRQDTGHNTLIMLGPDFHVRKQIKESALTRDMGFLVYVQET